jgi:hypothetical protein
LEFSGSFQWRYVQIVHPAPPFQAARPQLSLRRYFGGGNPDVLAVIRRSSSTIDIELGGILNNDQTSIFITRFSGRFFAVLALRSKFSAIYTGSPPDKKFPASE